MRPATPPDVATSDTANRMANGDTQPRSVTGTLKSTNTAPNEPASIPALKSAKPRLASNNTGRATNGTSPTANAAQAMMPNSVSGLGERSAQRPPNA